MAMLNLRETALTDSPCGMGDALKKTMPYSLNSDLPATVRKHLPGHAQDIYRAAFNAAYQRYGPGREDVAHRIAWAAVKRSYVQRAAGIWVRRPVSHAHQRS